MHGHDRIDLRRWFFRALAGIRLRRAVGATALVTICGAFFLSSRTREVVRDIGSAAAPVVRDSPWALEIATRRGIWNEPELVASALDRLRLPHDAQWPEIVHALRLWGTKPFNGAVDKSGDWALRLILDSEKMEKQFPSSGFHQWTEHGLMFSHIPRAMRGVPTRVVDPHRGKTLSVLAMTGMPSTTRLMVHGREATIANAVSYCMWNFTLDEECAWDAIVLALYLPPEREWRNKYGEMISFDEISRYLLAVDLAQTSCYGCHVYFALAALVNIDTRTRVMTDSCRADAMAALQAASEHLRRAQRADGSWSAAWRNSELPRANLVSRLEAVTVTGHTLEWLAFVPRLRIDDSMVRRALAFLVGTLLESPSAELAEEFSAYSHAANALRLWCPAASMQPDQIKCQGFGNN